MADDHPTFRSSGGDAGEVARHSFGTVRRGFDPQEVRSYLELLAQALERARLREQELLADLQDAEERARHPVIDESLLTSSLGQRSAAVLRGAHEEAARILSQAEEAAAATVRDAHHQATDTQVNAESSAAERIAEAELEANSLRQQAREEAAAVVETARAEGETLVDRAREQGRSMLDQAQEARRRVIADMAHRRRLMTEQIEVFRAARDEIAGSVVGVRRSIDRIVEDLSRAEDSARAAASGAARPRTVDVPEAVLVEEGERAVAELGELEAGDEPHDRAARPVLRFDDIATVVGRPDDEAEEPVPAAVHDWQEDPALAAAAAVDVAVAAVAVEGVEGVEGVEVDPVAGGPDVNGLFARLRAEHSDDDSGTVDAEAGESVEDASVEDASVEEEAQDAEPSPDAPAFTQRAEALDPIVATLSRRLKRVLQDDQNRLLDRLRKGTGEWQVDLLLDEGAQQALYADAAATSVRTAIAAGTTFARSTATRRQGKAASPSQRTVDAITAELASTVVTALRRRLEVGETLDASERIGAAYREWRGERIERLAEDSAVEAFSKGVLAGAGRRSVRWSRSEVGPGCADCEDNALAGSVPPGEEFPTGHPHPPAHAGCRCLVLLTPS